MFRHDLPTTIKPGRLYLSNFQVTGTATSCAVTITFARRIAIQGIWASATSCGFGFPDNYPGNLGFTGGGSGNYPVFNLTGVNISICRSGDPGAGLAEYRYWEGNQWTYFKPLPLISRDIVLYRFAVDTQYFKFQWSLADELVSN